ncbi:MAG: hypothetical protein ACOC80_15910 [Petrotogales bacterium]
MSLLNGDKNVVEIKLYYEEKKNEGGFGQIIVYEDDEGKKKYDQYEVTRRKQLENPEGTTKSPDENPIKILKTQWRLMTWGKQNDITSKCEKYSPNGVPDIDWIRYRDMRLKTSLVGWDLKDDEGRPVPCNSETINMVPPHVVIALLDKYDNIVNPTTEEESKN